MKRIFPSTAFRAFIATLLMVSWLVLSNHCALGLMSASQMAGEHAGCCGTQTSNQDGQPSHAPVRECCQSMQAVVPIAPGVSSPLALISVLPPSPIVDASVSSGSLLVTVFSVLETGPPEARSFAELVLQRGLRSHAPPQVLCS